MSAPEPFVLRQGNIAWLLGVDWHYADDAQAAKAKARELQGSAKGLRALWLPNADGSWLAAAVPAKLLKRSLRLAAAPMAAALREGIIILPVDEDRLWMAAFAASCVLPQRDVVVERAQRDAVLAQWFSDMGAAIHLYGDVAGALEDAPTCWQRLRQAWEEAASQQRRHWQVGFSPALRWVALTVLIGLLGAAGYVGLAATRQQPQLDAASMAQQSVPGELLRQQQEDAARQQRLRQRFEEEARQRRQALQQRSAAGDLQQLLQWLLAYRPPASYGKLVQMRCNSETDQLKCTPTWQLPASAGRLARLALGARADAQTVDEIFAGQPQTAPLPARAPASSAWPQILANETVWAAWLHDQVLLHGFRDVQWQAPQAVTLSAAQFQENGHSLRDAADAIIAHEVRVQIEAPLAQWMQPDWQAWLGQWPSKLEEAELRATRLSVKLVFYRPIQERL